VPRITLPAPETMTAAQLRVYEEILAGQRKRLVGPLRAVIHRPELADRWQKLGALLRFDTSVPPRLSELAILVTARRWSSQVEWHVHALEAARAGLPQDVIDAIRRAEAPTFADSVDAAVYDFTVELQGSGFIGTATYDTVLGILGTVGIVELTAIVGYYTMVAMTLNAHEIPVPDDEVPPLRPVDAGANGADGQFGLTALPLARRAGTDAGPVR
jgi:4-carboxymuconolactone decarboxylase